MIDTLSAVADATILDLPVAGENGAVPPASPLSMSARELEHAVDQNIRLKLLKDGDYGRYKTQAAAIKGFRAGCRKITTSTSAIAWVLRESRLGLGLPYRPSPSNALKASDIANGQRFVQQHGREVRYDADAQRWLHFDQHYNGGHWRDNNHVAVEAMAKATGVTVYDESKADNDPKLATWAKHSQSAAGIHGMLEMARSEAEIVVHTADLDTHPMLLNTKSSTVDLTTGEHRPAERRDLITKAAGTWYDPNATCPRWLRFLDEVFIRPDFTVDRELVDYSQRLVGYCLTGSVKEHVFVIGWGSGRNGKSVFLNVIRWMLGDYAGTTASELLLSKRNADHPAGMANLYGKRLVVSVETDAGRQLDESRIKNITGADPIDARWMYGNWFSFDPQFKLLLATNHRPEIRGVDEAIWRRIHLIPFLRTIDPANVDEDLEVTLRKEAPGILAWAVRGCLLWQQGGLRPPAAVVEATAEYRQESDSVHRFIEDCCECLHGAQVEAGKLYVAYKQWCEREGEQPLSSTAFGHDMGNRGYSQAQARINTVNRKIRRHIRLVSEAD